MIKENLSHYFSATPLILCVEDTYTHTHTHTHTQTQARTIHTYIHQCETVSSVHKL